MLGDRKEFAKSLVLVIVSALIYSLAIHGFINPANLYPSGFVGLSRLITDIVAKFLNIHIPFLLLYFLLQVVSTLVVIKYIGKRFAILTTIQFSIVSLSSLFIKDFMITDDRMLMVLFGAALAGVAIILALKGNASTGGTDYIAIYSQNKDPNIPIWDYVMYSNFIILFITGLIFGWETSLYSIVYQFLCTAIINNLDSRNKLSGLFIVTDNEDDVAEAIFAKFHRGITKLWGEGAYTKTPKTMLFMVVNTFEVEAIKNIILEIDEHAFINITRMDRVVGNFVRRKVE